MSSFSSNTLGDDLSYLQTEYKAENSSIVNIDSESFNSCIS